MCLGYLAAWPDRPDLTATRIMRNPCSVVEPNAPVSYLAGLMHWHGHVAQLFTR